MRTMSLFDRKPKEYPSFSSGRDAFKWAFKFYIDQGETPPDAAVKSKDFSTIICEGLGLPYTFEPEKKGMELYDHYCLQYTGRPMKEWAKDLAPYVLGAVTTGMGALIGSKIEQDQQHDNKPSIYDQKEIEHGESI